VVQQQPTAEKLAASTQRVSLGRTMGFSSIHPSGLPDGPLPAGWIQGGY
jgi:hypothetical protein